MRVAGYARRLVAGWAYAGAKGAGLPLVRREAVRSGLHETVFPNATYSPWLTDVEFQRVRSEIRRSTLVDQWRCYELWQLVAETRLLAGDLLEVGVWRGGTAALIAARARSLGLDASILLADTFRGVVKVGEGDSYYAGGEHGDTSLPLVRSLLERVGCDDAEYLVGVFPDETGERIKDRTLRFCHIDVNVYASARGVLEWVWPRLVPGGIVVFDDYGFASTPGVTRLVNEWRERPGSVVLHNLNGHGVIVKHTAT